MSWYAALQNREAPSSTTAIYRCRFWLSTEAGGRFQLRAAWAGAGAVPMPTPHPAPVSALPTGPRLGAVTAAALAPIPAARRPALSPQPELQPRPPPIPAPRRPAADAGRAPRLSRRCHRNRTRRRFRPRAARRCDGAGADSGRAPQSPPPRRFRPRAPVRRADAETAQCRHLRPRAAGRGVTALPPIPAVADSGRARRRPAPPLSPQPRRRRARRRSRRRHRAARPVSAR